ncbi:MAG TPA: discoidin domain-containing protein [Cytophagales bacterium]|nr:discoidin domain-containing protein [Cytophagales bacterium]
MKKIIFLFVGLCISITAQCQTWNLVWSDEFNGTTLDQSNWNYETGTGVNGDFGTGQLDRATDRPENVAIEQGIAGANGGALRITTRKETFMDRNYTSGRINSNNKASWGPNHRIVARVWPKGVRYMGQGFAFWMMPDEIPQGQSNISWPQGGEIDIMEYVGSMPAHNLGSTHYAWDWNNNQWADWNHGHQGGYYSFADQQAPDSPEWIRVDLGSIHNVNRVVLNWENTGKTFQIQTSTDGTTWSTAYSTTSGDGGIDDLAFSARNARFVRMYGMQRSNDWGYALYEFQVFAGSATNIALNRPATTSSSQGTDVGPGYAFDGNTSTRWSSSLRNPEYQCCNPSSSTDPNVAANGWHTYGINWYSDRMEFFVDDNVYHIHYFNDGAAFAADGENQAEVQMVNGKRVRKSEFSNLYPEWHPFEHKMYAILSAGVGGGGQTYGGPIVNEAVFPADVYIDWVRVYSNGQTFNPPPSVNLTAPTGIETYPAPASINLTATASDLDGGAISSVSFYNGTTLIGTDNSAPYSFNWTNVLAGNYTISARATDNGGATSNSNSVIVAVNGAGSNLALNRPGTASSVTGTFIASNAFDASPTTRWESEYSDPQWIYVDLGNTYDINRVKIDWETAMAKDYQVQVSSNTTSWTTIRTVTNNSTAVNDLTGLTGSGRYIRIYGTARTTSYGYSILSMEVYGSGGTTNTPPTVSISAPSDDATFTAPANINITANASDLDGSVTQVQFYNGSTLLGTDASNPFAFNWTNVAAGTYTITAKATDDGGLTTISSEINITVNGTGSANLALNKTTTVSSTENAGTPGADAVDGISNTRWASAFSDPQWIYVDLGATYNINRVKITWENAYGKDYQIQASTNASTWTTIKTVTGNTSLINDQTGLSGSGRYVRIYGTARGTGWGYSIFELEVYGTTGSGDGESIPGKIQAESYDMMNGVQTETTADTDGGQNVGWIDAGDWMDYHVTVNSTGTYSAQFRVAGWSTGAQLQLKNGATVLASINVPNTGGGQVWQTVSANVSLTAGAQTLRVHVVAGGFNFNWMNFVSSGARLGASAGPTIKEYQGYPNPVENIFHVKGAEEGGRVLITDLNGKAVLKTRVQDNAIDMSTVSTGVYIIHIKNKEKLIKIKVNKK